MSKRGRHRFGRRLGFWCLVVLLVGAQQWPGFWASETLVAGFLPAPLFYHVFISLAAVAVWWLGTVMAWPGDTADEADDEPAAASASSGEEAA